MEKRLHTDSRTSENFSESGLEKLTGQNRHSWLRYVLKEIIDNSLEATGTPDIKVEADVYNYNTHLEKINSISI
jgi:hypothetical protein